MGPLLSYWRRKWRGEVSERSKEPASKAGSLAKPGSWVRIPPSPPRCTVVSGLPEYLKALETKKQHWVSTGHARSPLAGELHLMFHKEVNS